MQKVIEDSQNYHKNKKKHQMSSHALKPKASEDDTKLESIDLESQID